MRYFEYCKKNPSRSDKGQRIFLLKEYYELYNQKAYIPHPDKTFLNKA